MVKRKPGMLRQPALTTGRIPMGLKDFLKTIAPEPEVLKAIRAEAKKNKTSTLSSRQIDKEISAYRKESRLEDAASKRRS